MGEAMTGRQPIRPVWRPPDWALQVQAMSEAFRPALELGEQVNRALGPIVEWLPDWLEKAKSWGEQARKALVAAYPPNWSEFGLDDFGNAVDLMVKHGLNVAWIPRGAIVLELLAAPDVASKDAVLVQREAVIVEDVEATLIDMEDTELAVPAGALREAVAAFRDGHHRASQALATVTLGSVIHDTFGDAHFAHTRKRFEALEPDEVAFIEARRAAVLRCVARALQTTDVAGPGFNRHAAAHRLSADQYTRPNAIASLMLVTGLLREVGEWAVEPDAEEPEAA